MKSDVFLSLEGIDGAGKSTQLQLLVDWLGARGHAVTVCREPGGTAIGEEIRQLLLHARSEPILECELLLYMASRAQLVSEVIRPALADGKVVLCDRFLLSSVVYQGHAGGLPPDVVRGVGQLATGGLDPDWTAVFDLDPERASARRTDPADRIEGRALEFHHKVRAGYLAEANRDPQRITVFDASAEPKKIHQRVIEEVDRVLAAAGRA